MICTQSVLEATTQSLTASVNNKKPRPRSRGRCSGVPWILSWNHRMAI